MTATDALRRRIRELRDTGIRQYRLARIAGIHPTRLSHVLSGDPVRTTDPVAARIASAVGMPVDEAFRDVDDGDAA